MRNLGPRMHAGIGAASAVELDPLAEEFGISRLQKALNGHQVFGALTLKTGKTRTVIAHRQSIGRHRITHLVSAATTRIARMSSPATRSRPA